MEEPTRSLVEKRETGVGDGGWGAVANTWELPFLQTFTHRTHGTLSLHPPRWGLVYPFHRWGKLSLGVSVQSQTIGC